MNPFRKLFIGERSKISFKVSNCTNAIALSEAASCADSLTYFQSMAAGAVSKTMAQTIMHPANTYKTLLQLRDTGKFTKLSFGRLFLGAGT